MIHPLFYSIRNADAGNPSSLYKFSFAGLWHQPYLNPLGFLIGPLHNIIFFLLIPQTRLLPEIQPTAILIKAIGTLYFSYKAFAKETDGREFQY